MAQLRQILFVPLLFTCAAGPALGEVYEFDKIHTQILFFVDHLGFSKSEGEFLDFEGQFTFSQRDFEKSEVELTIYTDSIDMDDERWNEKMKGKQYFDTTKYPTIVFRSTAVEAVGEKDAIVHGELTLLQATLPIKVNMRFNKSGTNLANGRKMAGFSGSARLNRSEYGMKTHLKFIGDEVEIRLEVEGAARKTKSKNEL